MRADVARTVFRDAYKPIHVNIAVRGVPRGALRTHSA